MMNARVSIALVGLAALLTSYSCVTVTMAEATNSTSNIFSASSFSNDTYVDVSGCFEEFFCEDLTHSECFGTTSSPTYFTNFTESTGVTSFTHSTDSTESTESTESTAYTEYNECIAEIYNNSASFTSCYVLSELSCCLSKIEEWEPYSEEQFIGYYECVLDAYECSLEYYSCVEDAVGEVSTSSDSTDGGTNASNDSTIEEGSASSDAAVMTGNDKLLSRLVCVIALIFTVAFAMGV